ncbi:phosphate acetyltransferase [Falsigemmobacter faecalis]|uniref:Phosphate acetyltransferase n=1 Tax=Falsigemmobacter faecalis TaxID=2488730 RepID=A0A3P3DVK1_9RHOB|nr:phosphate acetyltransferase [Falsigemmobacter faecalis]
MPQSAEIRRSLSPADIAAFAALSGAAPALEGVPEPLIGALFSCLLGSRLPGPGTGWLRQRLHFHAKARVNEPLYASVRLSRIRPEKRLADLECLCIGQNDRMICTGSALMLLAPGDRLLFSSEP